MIISNSHKFIFIHIHKTAGTSISDTLRPYATLEGRLLFPLQAGLEKLGIRTAIANNYCYLQRKYDGHIKAPELRKVMGEKYDSYFSFAFVRNPWDWLVSFYSYILKEVNHHRHDFIKTLSGFDEYIEWRCTHDLRYQKDFIYSDDNQKLVNFVGRFERIDEDFDNICNMLGINAFLNKLNVSNERPYREYYNNNTRELVRKAFAPDIELFEYDF